MSTSAHWPGDDGFERMAVGRSLGWRPIPAWGRDGWDLGDWPLVVVYHRGDLELAVDVEGDIDIQEFSTRQQRNRMTDEIAFFYWKNNEEEWVAGIETHEQMPAHLRDPFSWQRLNGSAGPSQ